MQAPSAVACTRDIGCRRRISSGARASGANNNAIWPPEAVPSSPRANVHA